MVRAKLIAEALDFAESASGLPGVTRIALLGSLATAKLDPKDVDLLVTVADGANLAPVAAPPVELWPAIGTGSQTAHSVGTHEEEGPGAADRHAVESRRSGRRRDRLGSPVD